MTATGMPSRDTVRAHQQALSVIQARLRTKISVAFAAAHLQCQEAIDTFVAAYGAELARLRTIEPETDASDPASEPDKDAKVGLVWLHTSPQFLILQQQMQLAIKQAAQASKEAIHTATRQAAVAGREGMLEMIHSAVKK